MIKKFFLVKNFQKKNLIKKDKKKVVKILNQLLIDDTEIIKSLSREYKYCFEKKKLSKFKKKFLNYRLIGMGGSILGAKAKLRKILYLLIIYKTSKIIG